MATDDIRAHLDALQYHTRRLWRALDTATDAPTRDRLENRWWTVHRHARELEVITSRDRRVFELGELAPAGTHGDMTAPIYAVGPDGGRVSTGRAALAIEMVEGG